MKKYAVTVHIADHVEHKGWVSRPEVFDSFEIECHPQDQMSTAHNTMWERDPEILKNQSLTFSITEI